MDPGPRPGSHHFAIIRAHRGWICSETHIGVGCKYPNEPYDIVINQYYGQSVCAMTNALQPFHLLVIALAGWLNRQQQAEIDYLIEEYRFLKEQFEGQLL